MCVRRCSIRQYDSTLTEDAFADGMSWIRNTLQLAEKRGKEITFPTCMALPAVVGSVSSTA